MPPSSIKLILPLLLALCAGALAMDLTNAGASGGGQASLPPLFADKLTFDEAEARASETGKPVFAVFSATWCAPCQAYKRGALSDPRVENFVKEHFTPAYVDVDQQRTIAQRFKVTSIPSTGVFKGGKRILGAIGLRSTDELLVWLEEADKKAAK